MYNGHIIKTLTKKIYTHNSSLHVSGTQETYGSLFYPTQTISYDAYNATNGYISNQILINTNCDITLSSSRFKGMDVSFTGYYQPTNVVHNESEVSFRIPPALLISEYNLAMNVTSESGCHNFTLDFLVSNISDHDPELSISISGNTLSVELFAAYAFPIGGGLNQQPTWHLYVIREQTGQTVRSQNVMGASTTVSLYGLSSGLYIVRAVYDGNTYSNKFLR